MKYGKAAPCSEKEVIFRQIHTLVNWGYQNSTIDRANGILTSDEMITMQKNGDQKEINNICSLQIYTMNDLDEMLSQNGFKVIEQHKMDAYTFNQDDQGYSILTVAMKE